MDGSHRHGAGTGDGQRAEFIAADAGEFTYDADGNLISDGRWTYSWDGENRLLSMTSLTSARPARNCNCLSPTITGAGESRRLV